jgi:hypothetical protein
MRILYNFENKILVKDGTIKTDVCSKAWHRYDIYDRSLPPRTLFPDGTVQLLDLGNSLFGKQSFDVVAAMQYNAQQELIYTVEPMSIVDIDTCECNQTCAYVAIYNIFGLDCISSSEFEIENGGLENFDMNIYSLMQYVNLRVRCSVVFVDADHARAWKKSIGAFRKVLVYYDGKEMEGYIDFSTMTFNSGDDTCNFDVVAKLI